MTGQATTIAGDCETLSGPALRTFFRIADTWRLDEFGQMRILGIADHAKLQEWKRGRVESISRETLERISCILGIYEGLHTLIPASADDWVHKPNSTPLFGGGSALDLIASGKADDLLLVRQYIDSQCN